jgi:O-antigen/teichoic acid export membrane protein
MVLASAILGAAGLLIALALGSPLLRLIYGTEFAQNADIFVWVMFAGAVGYLAAPLGYGLTAMRSFQIQPLILGLAIIINVVGCYLLVPPFGLAGAVWAWTGSRLCQVLLCAWAGKQRLRSEQNVGSPFTS